MLEEITVRVGRALDEKVFPGCIIAFVNSRGGREILPFGFTTYDETEEVTDRTLYDLASMTKSIPTASLALTFMAEHALSLTDRVENYLPELKNHHGATIEDLMRYRVRGPQLSKLPFDTHEALHAHLMEKGFDGPAGESVYTNLPAFILGLIVERVGAAPLEKLAKEYIFGPLYMRHATFFPQADLCAPTEVDTRGEVRGLPHDESAYLFAKGGKTAGHAGLFARAEDLLDFFETLLNKDMPAISKGAEQGLGWQLADKRFMGTHASERTFGKTGFTGVSCVCDMKRGVAFVILSNRTHPTRPADDSAIYKFRADIADILLPSA